MSGLAYSPQLLLPWESTAEEDSRFHRILFLALFLFAIMAVVIPLLPLPELASPKKEEAPPLTRVVLEKQALPPPVPQPKVVKPIEKTKPVPAEKKVPPKPAATPKPKPAPQPVDTLAEARKAATGSGVLAFQDDLQALRDTVDVETLNQTQTSRGDASATKLQRSLITSAVPASSGGIQTAALSTDTGGPALSGRETTAVTSGIAGNANGQGSRNSAALASAQHTGGRSDEAIRRVMDKNKGAIFAIYNRALRKDPLLEGKLVFEMVIEPSGAISSLTLLSSDLADDALTEKILSRIRLIQFGPDDAIPTRVNYSFDFLPYS